MKLELASSTVQRRTNYAVEFCTFGEIVGVCTPRVQGMSLTLGKPFASSWSLPCQVTLESGFHCVNILKKELFYLTN